MRQNKAYLEQIGGEWLDDFVYVSRVHLIDLGFEIVPFNGDDIENTLTCFLLDLKYDVVIGSVESTTKFFEACGIEAPEYLGYPDELFDYLDRNIEICNFKDLHLYDMPYFIKPAYGVKLFTGCLVESQSALDFLIEYYNVNNETKIYISEPINLVSEYRCFVHEQELEGIQHYLGDFTVYPDRDIIYAIINDYKSSNVAYTLDVGVNIYGETVLIEVNDMWAIGSYGMDAKTYTLMCVRRMREIGRQANGETEPLWKKLRQ